jgi:N-acyl-D-aspartate/D-glutamate deacylase
MLEESDSAFESGVILRPHVFGRSTAVLFSHQSTNPFSRQPSYMELSSLPQEERNRRLRDPAVRARILADREYKNDVGFSADYFRDPWHGTYKVGLKLNFEPEQADTVAAIAQREGRTPREVGYDLMLEDDCQAFLYFPSAGYARGNLEAVREMLEHPRSVLSGSDAGAHSATVCDGALPTFMLTYWARDRSRGPRLPLAQVIRKQTLDTATALGMYDRGLLAPGYLADVNVIDYDVLSLRPPRFIRDLPAGGGRLVQRPDGYRATIKRGVVTVENDEDTGARPGGVVRSQPRSRLVT